MLISSPGVSGAGGLGSSGEATGSPDWESDTCRRCGTGMGSALSLPIPATPSGPGPSHSISASYTDKPLCARPAQLLPSKPDGSLNGVLPSLLSFLLQKHMLKTKFQSLDPPTFCHPAAPTESSHSRLLQPSRFSGRRFGTSHGAPPHPHPPHLLHQPTLFVSALDTHLESKHISTPSDGPWSNQWPCPPPEFLPLLPEPEACLEHHIQAKFLAQNPPEALISLGVKGVVCAGPPGP